MNATEAGTLAPSFDQIFEQLGAGVLVFAADGAVLRANPHARRLLGLPESETDEQPSIARPTLIALDGSMLADAAYPDRRVVKSGHMVRSQVAGFRLCPDDPVQWLGFDAYPVCDKAGEVVSVVAGFSLLDQAGRFTPKVRRDRERFELAARATKSIVFDWDVRTGIFWANNNYKAIFGFPPPDRMAMEDPPLHVLEEDRASYQDKMVQAIAQGKDKLRRDFRFRRPDGGIGYAQSEFLIHYDDSGQPRRMVGVKRDVTELRQNEYKLAVSEERFRIVAEVSSDMLWELDPKKRTVWRHNHGMGLLGLDEQHFENIQGEWADIIADEDRERVSKTFRDAFLGKADRWREEYRIKRPDGSFIVIEDRAALIRNDDGRVTRVVGAVRDISEVRRMEEFLRENQALEALGKLTGGVAHDFNNMLMIIMGNTEILMDETDDPATRELLELIETAARNGAELTSRLLSFARQKPMMARRIDVADQLERSAKLIRHGLPDHISLSIRVQEKDLYARVDPSQLDNALVNLALNARDAMTAGGEMTLEAVPFTVDEEPSDTGLAQGDYVRINLRDTGAGMAPDVVSRVFQPFFTTKPTGEGTGLGLSMVYGFAKQSGGHVSVDSTPGEGTLVSLYLPASVQDAESTEAAQGSAAPACEGRTVLLVEDDDHLRAYFERILRNEGYAVLSAGNSSAALELLDEHDDIGLIFSDFVMPGGMNGLQLVREARRRRGALGAVLSSGYIDGPDFGDGTERDDITLLQKPYSRGDLMRALADAMPVPANREGRQS